MSGKLEQEIREWIVGFLREQCGVSGDIDESLPLFSYMDSFQTIGFFLACEERFASISPLGAVFFTGASVGDAIRLIATRLAAV